MLIGNNLWRIHFYIGNKCLSNNDNDKYIVYLRTDNRCSFFTPNFSFLSFYIYILSRLFELQSKRFSRLRNMRASCTHFERKNSNLERVKSHVIPSPYDVTTTHLIRTLVNLDRYVPFTYQSSHANCGGISAVSVTLSQRPCARHCC